ncbi:MAG TPA: hypothetical protein VJ792_01030 [Candidatus Nitrosotalea sp.]|nr:hypothetical protein [Candidatus Nitrosotalea sp.]
MLDIDDLIRGLDGFILSVSSGNGTSRSADRRVGIIGLDVSLKISPLDLSGGRSDDAVIRQRVRGEIEPLIDVIEDMETIRVIALLPGIRGEDVRYTVKEGYLELEIVKDCVYRKEIPCNARPDQISVRSTTLNNSVLEIVFSKKP